MPECQQCQDYEFKQKHGCWPSGRSFNRWAMWGCTCTPEQEAAALHSIDIVTR